jgi:hypothetical protein
MGGPFREGDQRAVRRPGRYSAGERATRERSLVGPVGVHDVDVHQAGARDGEGDLRAVRRPRRSAVFPARRVREIPQPAAVGVHGEDVARWSGVVPLERDRRSIGRPGGLAVEAAQRGVGQGMRIAPVGIHHVDRAVDRHPAVRWLRHPNAGAVVPECNLRAVWRPGGVRISPGVARQLGPFAPVRTDDVDPVW